MRNTGLLSFVSLINGIGWFCGLLFVCALIFQLGAEAAHWIVGRL